MSKYLLLGSVIIKLVKNLVFLLDRIIYSVAKVSYSVFCYLSEATIVDGDMIQSITERIYAVLGILMVFVLAYNLLNYIIDPDKISDKKIGASAIIKDIIIALVVITISPMLFTKLYSLQNTIITSGVISNLIMGGYVQSDVNSNPGRTYIENGANNMVATVFSAFVTPSDDNFSILDCDFSQNASNGDYDSYCNAYKEATETGSLKAFGDIVDKDKYDYYIILSTAAGIVLTFFMLSFCLNLGKRVGKMAILQVLAPIPLILEIVPSKKGLRKTWKDELIKTYLEVFFFQGTVFITVYLITLVPNIVTNLFLNAPDAGILVKLFTLVFLIFGLLKFGKEAPQLVFDLLGIKASGTIKEAAQRALAQGAVTGGILGSTVGRFSRNFTNSGGGFKGVASGLAGAGSGVARTLWGARNVHSLKDAQKLRTNVNKQIVTAKVNRNAYRHAHGDSLGGVIRGHVADFGRNVNLGVRGYTGFENDYQKNKYTEKVLSDYKKLYSDNIENLWKNDSKWQAYNSELLRAEAIGDAAAAANAKSKRDARQYEVLKDKKLQFMEGAGRLNNFIDANQGIDGISKLHINLDDIGAISDAADAKARLGDLDSIVKDDGAGSGFKPVLDNLKNNTDYQKQKVAEKLRDDARQANKKAADDASNKGDKK